ncbi:MAG: hypothetical protein HFJ45_01710 [Clostridia bacterium]|nr:hypothetical protein [Clostridia bacterium]
MIKIILIIVIITIGLINYKLRNQLEKIKKINFNLRRNEKALKNVLDKINLKSKTAYREDIWKSHKTLYEIEDISNYKNTNFSKQ